MGVVRRVLPACSLKTKLLSVQPRLFKKKKFQGCVGFLIVQQQDDQRLILLVAGSPGLCEFHLLVRGGLSAPLQDSKLIPF